MTGFFQMINVLFSTDSRSIWCSTKRLNSILNTNILLPWAQSNSYLLVATSFTNLKNIDIGIDIDKESLENIDIDKAIQKNIDIDIDIDKDILENIDIDIDIDKEILENIDIDIDIDKDILENIDIDIDIDKEISENIDIDKISNRLEFGISNSPIGGT